ncbi:MAG: 4-hydroxy-tetrahydrodipicolinate reductase [Clostridiales bacterium]|nr:4-hydroxy-tetrahydrodipicolinate reductase [Clostridiales bacterium]
MKVLVSGIHGFMGREVVALLNKQTGGHTLLCGVDMQAAAGDTVPVYPAFSAVKEKPDCIVDFSHHSLTKEMMDYAVSTKTPIVVATTGQTAEEKEMIFAAAKEIPVFFSYNYSLGIAVLVELAKKTAKAFPDAEIEIVEKHHDRKLDAPSGTAVMLVDAIKEVRPQAYANVGRSGNGKRTPEEIGVHAVRMGNIVGVHEVMVSTQTQTITLKHEAFTRALFAEGALSALSFLEGKPAGLYTMADIVKEN